MNRLLPKLNTSRRHWLLTAPVVVSAFAAGSWLHCLAQCPVEPDFGQRFGLVVYEGETEVGRVYRDVEGPRYTEHWVLYPNFSFDQTTRAGASMQIVAKKGQGYASVEDFLDRVPFPKGSRYVMAHCEEFDELP
jgi:hypothetical protein